MNGCMAMSKGYDSKPAPLQLAPMSIASLKHLSLQVFLLRNGAGGRVGSHTPEWVEDIAFQRRLDQGWDLNAVRQVSNSSILCME